MIESSRVEPRRPIRFCTAPTGPRIAYATAGRGPALLVPAAWISHLELLWQDEAYRAFFAPLSAARTVVQYDRPGCRLSEPWPGPQQLDTDLAVLQTVADQLGLERYVVVIGLPPGLPWPAIETTLRAAAPRPAAAAPPRPAAMAAPATALDP